jgi:hypothetical protein
LHDAEVNEQQSVGEANRTYGNREQEKEHKKDRCSAQSGNKAGSRWLVHTHIHIHTHARTHTHTHTHTHT